MWVSPDRGRLGCPPVSPADEKKIERDIRGGPVEFPIPCFLWARTRTGNNQCCWVWRDDCRVSWAAVEIFGLWKSSGFDRRARWRNVRWTTNNRRVRSRPLPASGSATSQSFSLSAPLYCDELCCERFACMQSFIHRPPRVGHAQSAIPSEKMAGELLSVFAVLPMVVDVQYQIDVSRCPYLVALPLPIVLRPLLL